jgi:hypothetical protein
MHAVGLVTSFDILAVPNKFIFCWIEPIHPPLVDECFVARPGLAGSSCIRHFYSTTLVTTKQLTFNTVSRI